MAERTERRYRGRGRLGQRSPPHEPPRTASGSRDRRADGGQPINSGKVLAGPAAVGERAKGGVWNIRLTGEFPEADSLGLRLNSLDDLWDRRHGKAEYDNSHMMASKMRNSALLSSVRVIDPDEVMRLATERRAAFIAWMQANKVKAPEIERRTGIPRSTIYSYVKGKSSNLAGATEDRIAEAFGTTVQVVFRSNDQPRPEIGVYGKIGAKADVFPVGDYEASPMYDVALPPTLDPDEDYVAFEVEGLSMPPAEPGWVVVFRKTSLPVEELINTVCMIDTEDGRRLFKRLRRGYAAGHFNLESWDGSPLIENVRVVTALPFAALTPGRRGR